MGIVAKLLAGSQEDGLIGLELLRAKRPRLTKDIQGSIYAHISESRFNDFLESYYVKRARLLLDGTDCPDITRWAVKYRK